MDGEMDEKKWTDGERDEAFDRGMETMQRVALELYRRGREPLLAELETVKRERDEARAEVERLREMAHDFEAMREDRDHHASALKQERREVERLQGDVWALTTTLRNLPVPSPSLVDACTEAFSRGAEAMREACAKACRPMLRSMVSRSELAETLRALPIPEEP